jgi:hypothetical protein
MSVLTTLIAHIWGVMRAESYVAMYLETEAVVLLAFCQWCLFHVLVQSVDGEMLSLSKVTRSEMGAYLCIAANGVPPSVSKRMMVHVHCKSQIRSVWKAFLVAFMMLLIPFLPQHL